MEFVRPTQKQRISAIGIDQQLPQRIRAALEPADDFEPLPEPAANDWLSHHYEPGQSVDNFLRCRRTVPKPPGDKIYLAPLMDFEDHNEKKLQQIKEFTEAFFTLEVRIINSLRLKDISIRERANPVTGHRQIKTGEIVAFLRGTMPDDAFCVQAITSEDLYPDPSCNFVFGQASLRDKIGLCSFARYDPKFYDVHATESDGKLLLLRSCKVLAHEIGHMFSMRHCIYYRCVMNGSNHLKESDARPLRLCPVCLHKLYKSADFDFVERYERLKDLYARFGFENESNCIRRRLRRLRTPDQQPSDNTRESEQ